jgi:hypothetical protein
MSSLISLTPTIKNFDQYLSELNTGLIQIPEFQRDFVWDLENVINLLESIQKNYPIGSFLFWKPDLNFKISKHIGPYILKENVLAKFESINTMYILDGYQRMSCLYGCLMNPSKISNFEVNKTLFDRTFNIFYDLKYEEFISLKNKEKQKETYIIPVNIFLDYEEFLTYSELINSTEEEEEAKIYINRLKRIITTFDRYRMPVIEISGGTLDEAIDIFTLLNKEGKPITPDWILSAKTYSDDFRMGDKIDEVLSKIELYNFIDKKPKELAVRELIFRSIQSSFGDLYLDNKKTDIIQLSRKSNFKEIVLNTCQSVELATKFLFEKLGVVDNKLLPANMQFIFLVEFFNNVKVPTKNQEGKLISWFWQTSYSNYFTIFNPSKRKEAFKVFKEFIFNESLDPLFKDKIEKFYVPELSEKINLQGVRSKTFLLFLMNYSNNYKILKPEYTNGYLVSKLFFEGFKSDISKTYGESCNIVSFYLSEENLELVKLMKHNKKSDFSFLLNSEYQGKFKELFITDEMRELYINNEIDQILEIRLRLIANEERKFVLNLNLDYSSNIYLF